MDITAVGEWKVYTSTVGLNVLLTLLSYISTTVDPSDYKNGGQLTIPAGRMSVIWPVETFRDTSCETDEHFKAGLILHHSPVMVDVSPVQAFVTIRDKTGKSAVMYVHATLSISKTTIRAVYASVRSVCNLLYSWNRQGQ